MNLLLLLLPFFLCFNALFSIETTKANQLSEKSLLALQQFIPYHLTEPNSIGHLMIEGHSEAISQATWLYIKSGLDYYKKTKPIFIILELNTPGGELFPAQEISDALKEMDIQHSIPVVCFINNWAISAGAMLAYSCRFIVTAKDASMGAAEPVIAGEGIETKSASEKVNSAVRADFANRAAFFDRNSLIAEAMVDKDIILVVRDNQILKLANESEIILTGPNRDFVLSPKGKLLTLNAEEMLKYGVSNLLLSPQKIGALTGVERKTGRWPADKMLLFHAPFFDRIPNATIDTYQMDWKTRFFSFLMSPMIASLLMLGVVIGFYTELSTPGFGIPGVIGLSCLILMIFSSFALEIAGWLELIFILLGMAIMLIDLFLLPTFGLLGFIGLLFFLAGFLGLTIPGLGSVEYEVDTQTFNAAGQFVMQKLIWFGMTLIAAVGVIILLAKFFLPRFAAYSSLVLFGNEQDASKGYVAGVDVDKLPKKGARGIVLAPLRPSGKVLIDNMVYEAMSNGSFIEKGAHITVSHVDAGALVVNED